MIRHLLSKSPSRYTRLKSSSGTLESSLHGESDQDNGYQTEPSSISSQGLGLAVLPASPRRVPGKLPLSAWLIIIIEVCDACAYWGLLGPLQNYLQNKPDGLMAPRGLGLTQASASTVNQCFTFWSYLTPLVGAVVADQKLGRLHTMLTSTIPYILGLVVLLTTSQPGLFSWGVSFGGLVVALLLLGIGSGGIKPNVRPFIVEQYTDDDEARDGQKLKFTKVIDRDLTIQRILAFYYLAINFGALSPLITTQLEQHSGFSAAFAFPTLVFCIGSGILLMSRRRFATKAPEGSVVWKAAKIIYVALRNRGSFAAAKSGHVAEFRVSGGHEWDDAFVDSLVSALSACRLFLVYPLFFMGHVQMQTNFVSQARTMETHGLPNDFLFNIGPITVICLVPLLEHIIYPYLRSKGFTVGHVPRITFGFLVLSVAMAYTAVVQQQIYSSPPCFDKPRAGDCLGGDVPNQIHVALQTPSYLLVSIAEILAAPTGFEYAFSHAPTGMRSVVTALFLSTIAIGAMLAMALSQLAVDPLLVSMYACLSVVSFFTGVFLWVVFRYWRRSVQRKPISEGEPLDANAFSEASSLLSGLPALTGD